MQSVAVAVALPCYGGVTVRHSVYSDTPGCDARHAGAKFDVIDKEAVAFGIHAAVLGVRPCEGVGAGRNGERKLVPASKVVSVVELQISVNIKSANIEVFPFAHALGVEGDIAVFGEVVGGLNGGSGGGLSFVAALHAVGTAVVAAV